MFDGTPLYWTIVHINDGSPDAFGLFTCAADGEHALIETIAEALEVTMVGQLENMAATCTRTVSPNGAIVWSDRFTSWLAMIVPVSK